MAGQQQQQLPDGGAAAPSARVRVLVRCRPLSSLEQEHSCSRIQVRDRDTVVVRDAADASEARAFSFDHVLGPECDQADVFDHVAPLVTHVLDGLHATVFAYGQTGSGKTYTMDGLAYRPLTQSGGRPEVDFDNTPLAQHGVVLRVIQRLFDEANARQYANTRSVTQPHSDDLTAAEEADMGEDGPCDEVSYSFKCSYFQMYNEKISDLLRPTYGNSARPTFSHSVSAGVVPYDEEAIDGLRLRWHGDDAFRVENLFLCECDSATKMRAAFVKGVKERVMSSHCMNRQSSRSHCVFTIYVECRQRGVGTSSGTNGSDVVVRRSELTLVDLAGSERLGQLAANPSARLVRESIEINTSLLTLGKVIMALANAAGRQSQNARLHRLAAGGTHSHIPYRESKLTKLLKHALGGNSLTIMIACISPSDVYVEETVSTLLYAGRARNIQNVPHVNEDPSAAVLRELQAEVRRLREELKQYQAMATTTITAQEAAVRNTREGAVTSNANIVLTSSTKELPGETQALQSQVEQLADSLLAACGMLKRVLQVNGELRSVYETVKTANVAAAEREVQLNAENLQLRERLAVLESIVLQEANKAMDNDEDDDGDSAVVDEGSSAAQRAEREVNSCEAAGQTHKVKAATADERPARSARVETAAQHSSSSTTHITTRTASSSAPKGTSKAMRRENHRRRPLASLLDAYEQRYRNPTREPNYAAYYERARARLPKHNATAATIVKMEELLTTLPAQEVRAYVPPSLRKAEQFGALSFGGAQDDTDEFERRRQERLAKREALMQKQRELWATVRQDVRELGQSGDSDMNAAIMQGNALLLSASSTTSSAPAARPMSDTRAQAYRTNLKLLYGIQSTSSSNANNNGGGGLMVVNVPRRPHTSQGDDIVARRDSHTQHSADLARRAGQRLAARQASAEEAIKSVSDEVHRGSGNVDQDKLARGGMARLLRYLHSQRHTHHER